MDSAWVLRYLRDRHLVRLLRARHPDVFDAVRGRPRRWYDTSEELWIQARSVRREIRALLAPLVPSDPELAEALARVDPAERWLGTAAWIGVGITVVFVAAVAIAMNA